MTNNWVVENVKNRIEFVMQRLDLLYFDLATVQDVFRGLWERLPGVGVYGCGED